LAVLAVLRPDADVLGVAAAAGALDAAAGALEPLAEPPLLDGLLLPQAASKVTAAAATPGATHHRIRISITPFTSEDCPASPCPPARIPGRDRSRDLQSDIRWQSQARDSGYR
jgi:hypothetical protein